MHDLPPDALQLISSIKLPLVNIIVAVYKDDEELGAILNKTTGINGYIGKYWTGFFSLLIIKICSNKEEEGQTQHETNFDLIKSKFSSYHRLVIESMGDDEFLMESIVRYHLHVTQWREDVLASSLGTTGWKYPQGCGLRSFSYQEMEMEKKKKKTFLLVLRKTLYPMKVK